MDGESATASADARIPVACSLDDLALARRSDHVRRELFAGAEERIELADGYAFRFPAGGEWKRRIDEFVDVERRCCQFFRIEVSYEPGLGPIWLRLTGPEGTRAFVAETF